MRDKRERIERVRALRLGNGLGNAPARGEQAAQKVMQVGAARLQRQRAAILLLRTFPVPVTIREHVRQRAVSLGQVRIQFQRLQRRCFRLRKLLSRLSVRVERKQTVVLRQAGVCRCIRRVSCQHLAEVVQRILQALGGAGRKVVAGAQVELLNLGVRRRRGPRGPTRTGEPATDRADQCSDQVSFQSIDTVHRTLQRVRGQ